MTPAEIRSLAILPRSFYARPAAEVARLLLGKMLVHGGRAGRIVETEAYLGETDRAAHTFHGRTARTEVLYGEPGHAYVYLIYGMHECLNVVAEPAGSPGCVLIRALEPVAGIGAMTVERPRTHSTAELCSGPGNLTRAMGISRRHYGADLTHGALTIRQMDVPREEVLTGPRVGIRHSTDWELRFHIRGNPSVSSK